MNGICGIHASRAGAADGSAAEGLDAMLAALADYGAEAAAWTEPPVALGGRRSPDAGGCPATGQRRSGTRLRIDRGTGFAVAADARLDDRGALCDALGVPHAERAGLDDADILARAWARWGRDCPDHLLGDYAFAVWDRRARTLFCARDPVGARPFYYAETTHGFVFASAVEAVLAAPGVDDRLDESTVATWLVRRNPLSNTRTFFAMVRKLPPGHALTVAGAAPPRLHRHWRPERAPRAGRASDDAYADEFLDLYARAVRDRLRGPDPVGAHLSGGLDSSTMVVLAARELRREGRPPPLAYTWLPPRDRQPAAAGAPEYEVLDAVCAREELRLFHQFEVTPEELLAMSRRDGVYPGRRRSLFEASVQRRPRSMACGCCCRDGAGTRACRSMAAGSTRTCCSAGAGRGWPPNAAPAGWGCGMCSGRRWGPWGRRCPAGCGGRGATHDLSRARSSTRRSPGGSPCGLRRAGAGSARGARSCACCATGI